MFEDFTKYNNPTNAGLLLPKINIEKKYYTQYEIEYGCSNFEFLKAICKKGIFDKKINTLSNKKHIMIEQNMN
jgi:AMMECR1 domain-containing protein